MGSINEWIAPIYTLNTKMYYETAIGSSESCVYDGFGSGAPSFNAGNLKTIKNNNYIIIMNTAFLRNDYEA